MAFARALAAVTVLLVGVPLAIVGLALMGPVGWIAAAIVLSVMPTLLLALYAQRYLVEGLSLGAVKG